MPEQFIKEELQHLAENFNEKFSKQILENFYPESLIKLLKQAAKGGKYGLLLRDQAFNRVLNDDFGNIDLIDRNLPSFEKRKLEVIYLRNWLLAVGLDYEFHPDFHPDQVFIMWNKEGEKQEAFTRSPEELDYAVESV